MALKGEVPALYLQPRLKVNSISQFVLAQEFSRVPMDCGGEMHYTLYKLSGFLYAHREAKDTLSILKLFFAKIRIGEKIIETSSLEINLNFLSQLK